MTRNPKRRKVRSPPTNPRSKRTPSFVTFLKRFRAAHAALSPLQAAVEAAKAYYEARRRAAKKGGAKKDARSTEAKGRGGNAGAKRRRIRKQERDGEEVECERKEREEEGVATKAVAEGKAENAGGGACCGL